MKKRENSLVFLFFTYPYGIISGVIFWILVFLNFIVIKGWKRFPRKKEKLILVSNHPSLLEPFLLPALFLGDYLFSPFKFAPWSTPDKENFYDKWYWFWARPRVIPIKRGSIREEAVSLIRMKKVLENRGIIIFFPEGGRTYKGKRFLKSFKGKKIRELKEGIGWLVLKTKANVLPVWVEGTDKVLPNISGRLFSFPRFNGKIVIKIGNVLDFKKNNLSKEEITRQIASALLNLADE